MRNLAIPVNIVSVSQDVDADGRKINFSDRLLGRNWLHETAVKRGSGANRDFPLSH
jgi:hypothetical protein